MTDILLAVLSISALGAFVGLIAWKVPALPLLILFAVIVLMAGYDFWRDLRMRRSRGE